MSTDHLKHRAHELHRDMDYYPHGDDETRVRAGELIVPACLVEATIELLTAFKELSPEKFHELTSA